MSKITPSLWFDANCEEAINFYIETFNSAPNKKTESKIVTLKRYPEDMQIGPVPNMAGKVLTVIFELAGQQFMALDGGPLFKPNEAVSFAVDCADQAEVDHFWNKLTEGGDPNSQQCGWLKDKFGLSWQILPKQLGEYLSDANPAKANAAMQAMLKMKKIVIADLKQAHDQA